MRLAVWSGPRNLSTALMYAFAQRADCTAWDEPFYAAYLAASGLDHPMRAEVLAAGLTDPAEVAARIASPQVRPLTYLKLMAHHHLPGFPEIWMDGCRHVMLIRHPARVLASYAAKREAPELGDLGFVQQAELFERLGTAGQLPVVIDSEAIRADPESALRRLCVALGIGFDPAMLHWAAGPKPQDGVWAPHWYDAVHRSTGFAGPEGAIPQLEGPLAQVAAAAMPAYERLAAAQG